MTHESLCDSLGPRVLARLRGSGLHRRIPRDRPRRVGIPRAGCFLGGILS